MKKLSLSLILSLSYILTFAQDYQVAINKARFLIQEHQKQTQVPGIQVAVMVDGSIIWCESFGYSDLQNKIPVNDSTMFRIASVSKSVTSIALGKMIDLNEIDIDKDIHYYLPEFPKKTYQITARQLASSTAGIRHYTRDDPEYNSFDYPDIISSLERFKNDEILFEPGTDYHYSSYGWVLLSALMQEASGKSFFQLMEGYWQDLGMTYTSFDYPNKKLPNTSNFYIYDTKKNRKIAPVDNRSYIYAGGGYLSTAKDLVKMGSQIINNNYLTERTRNELLSSYELKNGSKTFYGLGWESGKSRAQTPIVYHSGNMPSARSHLAIYPEKNVIFAYIANTGDHIFFNEREAHNIAELFVNKNAIKPVNVDNEKRIIGEWDISTTSLRNSKSTGAIKLEKDEQGIITGSLTFKRSRKKETYPILVSEINDNQVHLIAVSPMFLDIFLTINGGSFEGKWLHDFDVKGVPEEDEYWKPRPIIGKRVTFSNKN